MENISQYTWLDYSFWAKQLAVGSSDLQKELEKLVEKSAGYTKAHMNALKKENRKLACTSRLAYSALNSGTNSEKIMAYQHAIELLEIYPQLRWKGKRVISIEGYEFFVKEIRLYQEASMLPAVVLNGEGGSMEIDLYSLTHYKLKEE